MSTIDPGIAEPVKEAAEDVEADPHDKKQDQLKEEEEEDLKTPAKWWFASTACPLLAATFGPIANGFSICALVYSWRAFIPPGLSQASGEPLQDPHWLVAINGVSLASALIGNVALLLNMARRLKFHIAQPITITGFLLAGVLLIADMAALASSRTYFITDPRAIPSSRHALTGAFYFAIWAAAIYIIIGFLMCLTVHGARKGHYSNSFNLTPAQRTLMLQTMAFVIYELLGALVFSTIEGWKYLDAVYWSQVTLLTIGLGDYAPVMHLSRSLFFPFAIGGILMVGLVVGSIRSLVLERGKEKIAARITEKRRESAVNNVDGRKQTIKISWLAQADFSTDPSLTPAQRREEEFRVMRKVQKVAERERRYTSLAMSLSFALLLWFIGAAVFMVCEGTTQQWTYFDSLYFTFTVLMTIGYGDLTPQSNAGKSFFVIWSLLAVPSLTILISNMGDTFVKWFSEITNLVGSLTVLPEKRDGSGKKTTSKKGLLERFTDRAADTVSRFTAPGLLGETKHEPREDGQVHYNAMLDRLARRLEAHVEQEEFDAALKAESEGDNLERDIHFYHYVLSRELRTVQKDVAAQPPKQYSWHDWEYYLKLMGNEDDVPEFPGQDQPNVLVPDALRAPDDLTVAARPTTLDGANDSNESPSGSDVSDTASPKEVVSDSDSTVEANVDGVVDRATERKNAYAWHGPKKHLKRHPTTDALCEWSWLSEDSPLMSTRTEAEWILERLSAALVRELNRQRKGYKRQPPISMRHVLRAASLHEKASKASARGAGDEQADAHRHADQELEKAILKGR